MRQLSRPRTAPFFVLLVALLVLLPAPPFPRVLRPAVVLAAGSCPGDISSVTAASVAGQTVPVAYTGDWRGLYALGDITLSQRTKGGGGMVDEQIGHEALNYRFKV